MFNTAMEVESVLNAILIRESPLLQYALENNIPCPIGR
jgi:hypothetical protein